MRGGMLVAAGWCVESGNANAVFGCVVVRAPIKLLVNAGVYVRAGLHKPSW